jgi:8-oxo-dGTP pyrophosphatase MutT (NUDIX family)
MGVYLPICPEFLAKCNREIWEHHARKDYRPTGVAIVQNNAGDIFMQRSRGGRKWGCPQGGIEPREDIIVGTLRELRDECGIVPYAVLRCCHVDRLETPFVPDGFEKGKRYYYFYMRCHNNVKIKLQKEEVLASRWVSPEQARNILANAPAASRAKAQSLLRALDQALLQYEK